MNRLLLVLVFSLFRLHAEGVPVLTLEQAQEMALRNHPRIAAASLNSQAAEEAVKQVRSAMQASLSGNVTGVGAQTGTSIAAGALQTSGLSSRGAVGLGFSQLLTDFGRTSNLADSASARADAQGRGVDVIRAQVLLLVQQSYYVSLSAQQVLKVAQARMEMQRLTLRQIRALSEGGIRSTLDVSFAEVALSESELALYKAENDAKASLAALGTAMGEQGNVEVNLADVPLPSRLADGVDDVVVAALRDRPELSVAKLTLSAAEKFSEAERRLKYPSITAIAAVGALPAHTSNLKDSYSAGGLNISLPFLNGGLFASRRSEAVLRARSAEKDVKTLTVQVAGSVRAAWFEVDTAWRRLDVTARLVDQTAKALHLAQTRYETGLSGILELTQSQLSLVSAQIGAANAKYEYLIRVANLNYASGALR